MILGLLCSTPAAVATSQQGLGTFRDTKQLAKPNTKRAVIRHLRRILIQARLKQKRPKGHQQHVSSTAQKKKNKRRARMQTRIYCLHKSIYARATSKFESQQLLLR